MTDPISDGDDPGWGVSPATLPLFLVGPLGIQRALKGQRDGLLGLRALFLTFCGALVLIGVVVLVLSADGGPSTGDDPNPAVAAGLLAFGAVALVASRFFEPSIAATTPAEVAGRYRTRFFLRIAFAEMSALLGFVGVFLIGEPWPYGVGLVVAAVGFARAAPTRAHLRADQDALTASGSPVALTPALRALSFGA